MSIIKSLTGDSENQNWWIDWEEQYSQLFSKDNWYTYNFAHIEFEWDKMMGGLEATIIILGLGFRWRWNYTITEEYQRLVDLIEQQNKKEDEV